MTGAYQVRQALAAYETRMAAIRGEHRAVSPFVREHIECLITAISEIMAGELARFEERITNLENEL